MAKLTGQFTTPSLDSNNNKTHKPFLHGVVFVFTGATKVTRETDAKGKYSFDLANGEYEVSVYLKGNTEKDRFDMRAGEKFTVTSATQADALEKWLQVIGTSGKDELATYYENLFNGCRDSAERAEVALQMAIKVQNKSTINTEITSMEDLSGTFIRKIETANRINDIVLSPVTREYLDYARVYDVIDVSAANFDFKTIRGNALNVKKEAFEVKSKGINYLECVEKGQKIDVSEFIDGATTNLKIAITYENISTERTCLFFRNSGGRLDNDIQIFHNSLYSGSGFPNTPGYLSIFIRGATEGLGNSGQLLEVVPDGRINNIILELDLEKKVALFFHQGELIDTVKLSSGLMPSSRSYLNETERSNSGSFSAGVIRFSTVKNSKNNISDLQKIHNIYRYNENYNNDNLIIDRAKSYLVSEYDTQNTKMIDILYKDLNHVGMPASLTKIATAICMLDLIKEFDLTLDYELVKTEVDETRGSGNNLLNGDVITCRDALYNLMLPSSNVTANIIARTFGEMIANSGENAITAWIRFINKKALDLGMTKTSFDSPSGLGANASSSSKDISKLMFAALNYTSLMEAWAAPKHTMLIKNKSGNVKNVNIATTVSVVKDRLSIGGKTGTLFAYGYNVGFFYYSKKQEKLYSIVVFGCSSDANRTLVSGELIRVIEGN